MACRCFHLLSLNAIVKLRSFIKNFHEFVSRLTLYLQTCLHLFNICHCYMRLLFHVEGFGEEMEIVLMSWICCVFFIIIVCQRVLISFHIKLLLLVVRGKNSRILEMITTGNTFVVKQVGKYYTIFWVSRLKFRPNLLFLFFRITANSIQSGNRWRKVWVYGGE